MNRILNILYFLFSALIIGVFFFLPISTAENSVTASEWMMRSFQGELELTFTRGTMILIPIMGIVVLLFYLLFRHSLSSRSSWIIRLIFAAVQAIPFANYARSALSSRGNIDTVGTAIYAGLVLAAALGIVALIGLFVKPDEPATVSDPLPAEDQTAI